MYNPQIHHRSSIRLKGYDYSQAGLYFITICVQNRECLYGNIISTPHPQMILNDAGKMVEKWYCELENKFPNIKCHEMIIMPNHFHCIIEIIDISKSVVPVIPVGADLRVCPNGDGVCPNGDGVCPNGDGVCPNGDIDIDIDIGQTRINIGQTHRFAPTNEIQSINGESGSIMGEHIGSPLHRVVQWFKTMSTNEYIRGVRNLDWQPFDGKLWQRNYWEHIIRNNKSYEKITEYIIHNPENWDEDQLNMT